MSKVKGIEAIRERVLEEARTKAASILEAAKQKAEDVQKAAEVSIASAKATLDLELENSRAREEKRLGAQVTMQKKSAMLQVRQSLINQVLEQAKCKLENLPSEERETLYLKALKREAKSNDVLVLNRNDRAMGKRLIMAMDLPLILSDEIGTFSGGFNLKRGAMTITVSFDALFQAHKETLTRIAAEKLFSVDKN